MRQTLHNSAKFDLPAVSGLGVVCCGRASTLVPPRAHTHTHTHTHKPQKFVHKTHTHDRLAHPHAYYHIIQLNIHTPAGGVMGGVPKVLWAVGPVPWLEGWSYGCQAVQSCKKDESECVSRMDQSV